MLEKHFGHLIMKILCVDFHFENGTKIPFELNANEWEPLIHFCIKRFFNSWISLWFNNWYKMEDDFSFIFSYDLSGGQESWYHDVIKGKLPINAIYVKNPDSNFLWIFAPKMHETAH